MTAGAEPPIRAVVVDDEALARDGIRIRLERQPDITVVGEFDSAEAALERLEGLAADVMFLDVRMPGMSGLDLVEHWGASPPPAVVFVTAYDSHAIEAFGVRALDYLVKPFDDERFEEMLDRLRARIAERRDGALGRRVRSAVQQGQPRPVASATQERIPVKTERGVRLIAAGTIDWVEADRDHVVLHVDREALRIRNTLTRFHRTLDQTRFVRIHRSVIVNLDRVVELEPYFHGEYIAVLANGRRLRVSRSWREALARRLGLGL
ncbi:MAG: LytR/AlgR family response regulator transcription factor [Gemmatimonadales bacterium]